MSENSGRGAKYTVCVDRQYRKAQMIRQPPSTQGLPQETKQDESQDDWSVGHLNVHDFYSMSLNEHHVNTDFLVIHTTYIPGSALRTIGRTLLMASCELAMNTTKMSMEYYDILTLTVPFDVSSPLMATIVSTIPILRVAGWSDSCANESIGSDK